MITRSGTNRLMEHTLGSLGLLLMGLTGWAVERRHVQSVPVALITRVMLAAVAAVGWSVDRLSRSARTSGRSASRTRGWGHHHAAP
jgi:hypothetical protein